MSRPTSPCRSCGAPMHWSAGPNGQIPIDAEPCDEGNVRLFVQPGGTLRAEVLGKEDAAAVRATGVRLRLSHFATCPNAKSHRKVKP